MCLVKLQKFKGNIDCQRAIFYVSVKKNKKDPEAEVEAEVEGKEDNSDTKNIL